MKKKSIEIPKFTGEAQEADWWASLQGREFVKQNAAVAVKKGAPAKGSRLAGQLNRTADLVRILYDTDAQSRMMRQIVDHATQVQRRSPLSANDAAQFWNAEVAFSLLNCGMLFKEPKWANEREFRLVVMGGDEVKPFSVDGRPRVALQFDRGAIVEVVRGPNAGNQLTVERIRTLLRRYGCAESLPIREAVSG